MLPRTHMSAAAAASLAGLRPAAAASPAGFRPAAAAAPNPAKKNSACGAKQEEDQQGLALRPTPGPRRGFEGLAGLSAECGNTPGGRPPPGGRRPIVPNYSPKRLEIFGFHIRKFLAGRAGPLRLALGRRFLVNSPHVWRLEIPRSAGNAQPLQGS